MKFHIRHVDGDEDEINDITRELHLLTFGKLAPFEPTHFGDWWFAYHGDDVAGFAGIEPSYSTRNYGYLCRCGVLPRFRGYGLQARFLRVREARAKRLGWIGCVTDTCHNPKSVNNLIAAGYKLFTPPKPWALSNSQYWRKTWDR